MGLNNWLGTFAKAEGLDLSSDLEQAYEAAELERDDQELLGEDLEDANPETDRDSLARELTSLQKQEKNPKFLELFVHPMFLEQLEEVNILSGKTNI